MRLFLIRHGQTPANVLGELDTAHPGPGLTELGTRQAAVIPDALRLESIDAVFASTLVRTHLTAQPLAVVGASTCRWPRAARDRGRFTRGPKRPSIRALIPGNGLRLGCRRS